MYPSAERLEVLKSEQSAISSISWKILSSIKLLGKSIHSYKSRSKAIAYDFMDTIVPNFHTFIAQTFLPLAKMTIYRKNPRTHCMNLYIVSDFLNIYIFFLLNYQ
jgi:hypothetical protein